MQSHSSHSTPASKVTFRLLTATDLNEFVTLCRNTYSETYNTDPAHPEFSESDLNETLFGNAYLSKLKQDLTSPHVAYILAVVNGKLAGYAKLIYENEGQGPVELDKLYFLKQYQHCGYGKLLLVECCMHLEAREKHSLYWFVNAKNNNAIGFYNKIGGRVLSTTFLKFCDHWNKNYKMEVDVTVLLKNCLPRVDSVDRSSGKVPC